MRGLIVLNFVSLLLFIQESKASEVRLVGGKTPYEGRLEVRNDTADWGTVCDDNFDTLDAAVVCRMLGFENTEYATVISPSKYGQGSGKIYLDELGCIGNETDILQCNSSGWQISDCGNQEDVGVSCQTHIQLERGHSGRVEIRSNGSWAHVCAGSINLQTGQVICRMLSFSAGHITISETELSGNTGSIFLKRPECSGSEYDISKCNMTTLTSCSSGKVATLDCPTTLRLRNGTNNQTGRVEVFLDGEWGTICDDSFDNNAASVICGMLGYNTRGAKAYGSAAYGKGSGRIMIGELKCSGTEKDISECPSKTWGSETNCGHSEDAAVKCGTELRLIDGPTSFSGRLEIRQGGSWQSVCDKSFGKNESIVVCNMLGFIGGNVTTHRGGYFGNGINTVANYIPQCYGNETDLVECSQMALTEVCNQDHNVGINCFGITRSRLVGGPTPFSGRVEVYLQEQGVWSGICEQSYTFTVNDAKVLCKMIGKPNQNPSIHNASILYEYVIRGKGISNLNCNGFEEDISDCRAYTKWGEKTCDYPDYVGINCDPVTSIRLTDGPSPRAGRVEVLFNGTWGSICSDRFDKNDSTVICKMLGFGNMSYVLGNTKFKQGQEPTIVHNLECRGYESDVSDCKAAEWDTNGTCLGYDIGVACGSSVRLVNGSYERSGRVEIFVDGEWRTVCSDAFDESDANVTCKMAGFRFWNATVMTGSSFGVGSGKPYVDNLTCLGDEPNIVECNSSPWNVTACKTGKIAAVDCRVQTTPIRFTDGATPYSGRIEVFHNKKWGDVCSAGFTKSDAQVVCRAAVGPNNSPDFSIGSTYRYYTNNVMINGLTCSGNESDISLCPSDDWDSGNSECGSGSYFYAAELNCLTPVTLIGGVTTSMGVVQVTHSYSSGSICEDEFTVQNVKVLCSMMGHKFTSHLQWPTNDFHFKMPFQKTLVKGLKCQGTEKDIYQCSSNSWGITNCSSKALAINCKTPVQLSGEKSWRSGKVEIFNGSWTTVCYSDNTSNAQNSKVLCGMLGLSTSEQYIRYFEAMESNTNGITISCTGNEDDISKCRKINNSCSSYKRLGTTCETSIELLKGRTKFMGIVAIQLLDGQMTITNITEDSVSVVCRSLGYNFTSYPEIQNPSDFEKEYWSRCIASRIENLVCTGLENDIMDCVDSTWNYDSCRPPKTGVNCQTPLRLTNNGSTHFLFGNLDVKFNKTWYPVCSDAFTLEDAYVICRMLGHKHSRNATFTSVSNAAYGVHNLKCKGIEDDISQCSYDSTFSPCLTGSIRIDCRSNVRLVGGPSPYRGKVEVYYNGSWGPICGGYNEERVICKMMGFIYDGAKKHTGETYTNKTNSAVNYTITNLSCNGQEDDLTECSSNTWNSRTYFCYQTGPLEIECNTPVYLQGGSNRNIGSVYMTINGSSYSICADNFTEADADVICRMIGSDTFGNATIYRRYKYGGYYDQLQEPECKGSEMDLQECQMFPVRPKDNSCSQPYTAVAVNCRPHTPIRINGSDSSKGLVEIFAFDRWGTICNDNFDVKDASVLCKMLGFKMGEPGDPITTGINDVITKGLTCDGTENDVSECGPSSSWYSYNTACDNVMQSKATVKCSNDRVRLVGGVNDYKGRVEFLYLGTWGKICDNHFDTRDAEVICRQIGLVEKNASIYNSSRFGRLYSNLIVEDLNCTGSEVYMDDCGSFPWSFSSGRYCDDVGVNCRPKTPLRLVNGTTRFSGRVEMEYKGIYGTICDREFEEADAKVICRALGFSSLSVGVHKHGYYGEGSGNITISHLGCVGDEPDISECNATYRWNSPYKFCTHANDVSVKCDTPVRLSGGWTKYDGIVEVYINKTWNHVCYDGFSQTDAKAVCSLAGLRKGYTRSNNVTVHSGVYYGLESLNSKVGSLGCSGTEDDLFFCGSSKWMTSTVSCKSKETAAINCRPVTEFKLINKNGVEETGTNERQGRVEVFYDNEWGTICDDQFDNIDATVLCQMIGFPFGEVVKNDQTNKASGPIVIDDLNCLGIESDISECRSREWGTHNCGHEEDVHIRCANITHSDPCKATEHTRLPNLEYRYVNVKVGDLQKPINDSKLPLQWYNVGNITMPKGNTTLSHDSCGTQQPIYSIQDHIPNTTEGIVEFTALQMGRSDISYQLQMVNCYNRYFVYRLKPTINEQSGYCFGIGSNASAPDFVANNVSVIMTHDERNISFSCKFKPSENDILYQVSWIINGLEQLTKQYYNRTRLDDLKLTEQDFEDNDIGLGVNISCAVRAFKTTDGKPGTWSETSKPFFFGIEIVTPELTLRKGETKSIKLINRIPIICIFDFPGTCSVRLQYFTPDYGTCSSGPSFQDGCDNHLNKDSLNSVQFVNISSTETGQYAVAGHFYVYLTVPASLHGFVKLWRKPYKLPAIKVDVLPEENKEWRGKMCSARNDPHMYTFDKSYYEHHEDGGIFVLYRHKEFRSVEIQHKVSPCTNAKDKAKCNCGVAVKAGRDVYVIDVCGDNLDIGYKRCDDETLSVKKENDFTYTVYLPYGTAVRARIDNQPFKGPEGGKVVDISILPSLHDEKNTLGLCGTLNGNQSDDYQHRNEHIGVVNTTDFIQSWKVFENESLFSSDVNQRPLEPWVFPMCLCKQGQQNNNIASSLSCEQSVAECTPGSRSGQHTCGEVLSRRTRRSLANKPRVPVVRQTNHYWTNINHHMVKRDAGVLWTEEKAKNKCEEFFNSTITFNLCRKVPATHTNVSVQNCILDILLTNSSLWIDISRQSMQDTCQTEIHRNATVVQEIVAKVKNMSAEVGEMHVGSTIAPAALAEIEEIEALEQTVAKIAELSCLNNCSGHGLCKNGDCSCEKGFGATDCSLDINKPPRLIGILDEGLCDENVTDCTHIYVFGEMFVGTNITCRLRKFTLGVNERRVLGDHHENILGTADSLVEAMCSLNHLHRKRAATQNYREEFVHGYQVSVSNDGEHFSNNTEDIYIFDSTCQSWNNESVVGMQFSLKSGYCHIEGECVLNGTSSRTSNRMMCDTRVSNFSWSEIPTTTSTPSTKSSSSNPDVCGCNMENTLSCNAGICKCKDGWTGKLCDTDIDECSQNSNQCKEQSHTACQNKQGSFDCLCLRGFEDSSTGCKELPEPIPADVVAQIVKEHNNLQTFTINLRIEMTLNSSYNLNVSTTYKQLENDSKTALSKVYQNHLGLGFKEVVILSLRSGSLQIEHAVITQTEEFVDKALSVVIAEWSGGGSLLISGQVHSVSSVKIGNAQVRPDEDLKNIIICNSYTQFHPCGVRETCVVENETPICKIQMLDLPSDKTKLITIISSSAGGVLVVVILVLVVCICRIKKKVPEDVSGTSSTSRHQNEYHDMNSTEMLERPKTKEHRERTAADNLSYDASRSDFTTGTDGYIYYYGKGKGDGSRKTDASF